MKTTRAPSCQCPHCHKEFDSVTDLAGGAIPKPCNWTICLGCCSVLRFTETMSVRAIDEMERAQLEASRDWPEFERVIAGIRELKGRTAGRR